MTVATAATRRTFASLSVRNYRLYLVGQMVSLTGTWMQGVAQAWLVLELTHSGTALGFVTALQFLPVLLFGPVGGLVADRVDKRRVLYLTQSVAGLLALTLGLVVALGVVRLWMVFALAAGLGFVNLIDNPARQTFVLEMVGPGQLTNAVSLNSVTVNLARVFGPALAGLLIATVGLSTCFLLNAGSYVAVLVALALMHSSELSPSPPQPRARGQLLEGFRYVRSSPELLIPLLLMAVVGTLAYEFQVILPLVAKYTFHGGPGMYGVMSAFMGAGAVVGGLVTASRRHSAAALGRAAVVFGVVLLVAAAAPSLATEFAALVLVGATSITFLALGNTTLQLASTPAMRGRVMALWAVAFLGSTPIGGPIIGFVGQHIGPRYGLGLGGVATLVAGLATYRALVAVDRRAASAREEPAAAPTRVGDGTAATAETAPALAHVPRR
jgi:MFS family permease